MTVSPLLTVDGLTIGYGRRPASGAVVSTATVHDVSFAIHRGEALAVVGESGSGKTTLASAVLGLTRERGAWASGSIDFDGTELTAARPRAVRALFRNRIAYVPQDPRSSLNPVRTIGAQISEVLEKSQLPEHADKHDHRRIAADLLRSVGLGDAEQLLRSYPHELSGGMVQRVLIGLAVVKRPALLVADEPTSALDATVQQGILRLLDELREQLRLSLLLITHDLSIALGRTDRVLVLRAGRIEELADAATLARTTASPYVRQLLSDVPALNPGRYDADRSSARATGTAIEVAAVSKRFGGKLALDRIDLSVDRGSTHAIVGESGSGKTTLARIILRLEQEDEGSVSVLGTDTTTLSTNGLRTLRSDLQFVYQNPFTSLDPRYTVRRLLTEPLRNYGRSAPGRFGTLRELLEHVGLGAELIDRRPGQLSGGQRQRVAIARALVLEPKVLVLDEPTSALDVTVQAQVIDLLVRLQRELGLTYLFISHDLALVRQFADTVTVLYRGVVQETGPVLEVFERPRASYTGRLLAAINTTAETSAGAADRSAPRQLQEAKA